MSSCSMNRRTTSISIRRNGWRVISRQAIRQFSLSATIVHFSRASSITFCISKVTQLFHIPVATKHSSASAKNDGSHSSALSTSRKDLSTIRKTTFVVILPGKIQNRQKAGGNFLQDFPG